MTKIFLTNPYQLGEEGPEAPKALKTPKTSSKAVAAKGKHFRWYWVNTGDELEETKEQYGSSLVLKTDQ